MPLPCLELSRATARLRLCRSALPACLPLPALPPSKALGRWRPHPCRLAPCLTGC